MEVGTFAQELLHGRRALPEPDRKDDEVSNHDPGPLESSLGPGPSIRTLRLLPLRHHEVPDNDADERGAFVLVAFTTRFGVVVGEVDLARGFFRDFGVEEEVREEEAGEEGRVRVHGLGSGGCGEDSDRLDKDPSGSLY